MSKSKTKEASRSSKRDKYEALDKLYDEVEKKSLNRFAIEHPKNAINPLDKH